MENKEKTSPESEDGEPAKKKPKKLDLTRGVKNFFSDFKTFISRGNIMNLAVAVIIGAAFTTVVNGLVANIIMPFLALIPGQNGLSGMAWVLRHEVLAADGSVLIAEVAVKWGDFLQTVINFLLVAFTVFFMIRMLMNAEKGMQKLNKAQKALLKKAKKNPELAEAIIEEAAIVEPAPIETVEDLLKDIRSLLAGKKTESEILEEIEASAEK